MKQVFYVPERGDIVRLSLTEEKGRKHPSRRVLIVLSPQAYNGRVGLALLCPVVAEPMGYPFEVRLPEGLAVPGAVLADRAVCLDWRALRAEKIGVLPPEAVEEILGKLGALLA